MLLGWIAGVMAVTDPAVLPYLPTTPPARPQGLPEPIDSVRYGAGLAAALLVLALARLFKRRAAADACG